MKEGVCFASNKAIADACGSSPDTIKSGLARLEKCGFIKRAEHGKKRQIITLVDPSKLGSNEPCSEEQGSNENDNEVQTAPKHGSNEPQSISKSISKEYDKLKCFPVQWGNSSLKRIIRFYSLAWNNLYGTNYSPNYPKLGKILKPLLADYSEMQIASFVINYFEWHGASGGDEFSHKRLAENCFPLEWLPQYANQILAYLVNELRVDMEKPEEVRKYVVAYLKTIMK